MNELEKEISSKLLLAVKNSLGVGPQQENRAAALNQYNTFLESIEKRVRIEKDTLNIASLQFKLNQATKNSIP